MTITRLYLDHNAGAPVLDAALAAANDAARAGGNASSVHFEGRAARARVEDARRAVARLAGAAAANVVFTSGATEANVTALSPLMREGTREIRLDRLLIGATEHPSVLAGGRFAAERVETIAVDGDGRIRLDVLEARLAALAAAGERALVSVQLANSETGVIQPIAEVARIARARGAVIHCDAVQGAGRIRLDDPALDVDMMSLSAHKIGGLPGCGALISRNPEIVPAPLLVGGGQESRRRAGTQNVPGIAAFGAAATIAGERLREIADLTARRDWLEGELRSISSNVKVLGTGAPRLANTIMVAIRGASAETAVIAFDLEGVAISAGSACSSGKVGASHVVEAMGVGEDYARGAIRLSFGFDTSVSDLERVVAVARRVIGRLTRS
ncbi:cysteine desulfurase family protein [Pinisolibacter aquiterrae]|uniref:cysteine desulfurase family protein n=1 Tax=Pinisolibacter aquiterrae TaxID=2815579 RepID=UPI001C3C97B1|nr:aminotransferase class V-fold PLP-dependent enzyme [Pinisolibacter aquiterrae]MBV5264544.1 aminotransferase class V-fold PLP-dependent enzyme [Pinisolibacter aquiterrae]MCC8235680.1 aminotransferase class V-fold PLP-dependent enzyme [Pinisolibacter aquiterrae]